MSVSLSPSSTTVHPSLRPLWEGRAVLTAVGMLLTLVMVFLVIVSPSWVREAELRLYDHILHDRPSLRRQESRLAIVGIDEDSLAVYGQWPWPRYRLARLVRGIRQLGADVIALDVLMPEADRTSPDVIMAERQRDFGIADAPLRLLSEQDSNSRVLAQALREGHSVIGCYFDFSGRALAKASGSPNTPANQVVVRRGRGVAPWPEPMGVIRSVPALTAAATEGFTNVRHDIDGILRRAPLLIRKDGQYYPSLSLGAVLLSSPERTLSLEQGEGEATLLWGGRAIPLDANGNLHINFPSAKEPFPYISAQAILGGDSGLPPLTGKIVVVGAWAKALGDIHQVRYGRSLSALEVHASVIDNLLSGTFLSRPAWGRGGELSAVLFLGVLSTVLLSRMGAMLSGFFVVAASFGIYWFCRELLVNKGIFVSPLISMATPLLVSGGVILFKYGIEAQKVRQRNRELRQAHEAIEVVADAKSALESANLKLAEVDRLKSMFIASMSHELRTPLNSIIGFTSILLMGLAGTLNDEQQKQLAMVKSSSLHLLDLINDIIDLSKIEAARIDLRWGYFDLAKIVREVLATFQVAADQKSLHLTCDGPAQLLIRSDVRRVRQILVNLIGNAIKFTDVGSVSLGIGQTGQLLEVAVCDTGIGIKAEDMDKLFHYFSQITTDGVAKHEGTGLGLYLSQKLSHLLGGDIRVVSRFGAGSTFTLSLPVTTPEAEG